MSSCEAEYMFRVSIQIMAGIPEDSMFRIIQRRHRPRDNQQLWSHKVRFGWLGLDIKAYANSLWMRNSYSFIHWITGVFERIWHTDHVFDRYIASCVMKSRVQCSRSKYYPFIASVRCNIHKFRLDACTRIFPSVCCCEMYTDVRRRLVSELIDEALLPG